MQVRASGKKHNEPLQLIPEFTKFDNRKFSDEPVHMFTQKQSLKTSRDVSPMNYMNGPQSHTSSIKGLQSYA
jgi:hypothetical protein